VRIASVCSDFDVPLLGSEGCSIHLRSLARALCDAGHEVALLCAALGEGESAADAHAMGERFEATAAWQAVQYDPALWERCLERDMRSVAYNAWLAEAAVELLERLRPDMIYERYSLFGTAGLELARRISVPLVVELNAPLCAEQAGYEKFVLTSTAEHVEREMLAAADAVVAVSPWLRDFAVERGAEPGRVHVVPNGADRHAFAPALPDRENVRVIGYVGSFQPWHDLGCLLEAFARVRAGHPDAQLLLVGDGPERAATLREAGRLGIADAVVAPGNLPHSQAPAFTAAMDVAVVPYAARDDFYFSPMKLFESMAAGRPTVAAAIGQIRDVVEDGRTGVLYEPGDADALAAALVGLFADPARSHAIGAAAREVVLERHTWDAVAARVTEIASAAGVAA
jgi:glycosyltransferase involved in cell wall biosynthesis